MQLVRKFALALAVATTASTLASQSFAADHKVTIKGFAFSPAAISVAVGDTVTFTNADGAPHTATANDKSFDTGRLGKGESKTVTISKAGVASYFCAVHPSMKGKVTAK